MSATEPGDHKKVPDGATSQDDGPTNVHPTTVPEATTDQESPTRADTPSKITPSQALDQEEGPTRADTPSKIAPSQTTDQEERSVRTDTPSESALPQSNILVIEAEDVFLDVLQHFSATKYVPLFSETLDAAANLLRLHDPRLVIIPLPTAEQAGPAAKLLGEAQVRGASVLGLGAGDPPAALRDLVTRWVPAEEREPLLEAAGELLGERRAMPRARFAVPVTVANLGNLHATVISGKSLFIPTEQRLKTGQMVQISVDTGSALLRSWARVVRVGQGESGEPGIVLGIPAQGKDVRTYLSGLVRGLLLLEHTEPAEEGEGAVLPDSVGGKLAQRVRQEVETLKTTLQAQMTFSDALSDRIDALVESEAREVRWKDVRPALARKMNAQHELIKTILQRVNNLAAGRDVAEELKEALESQNDLQTRIVEQETIINELRDRLDRLTESREDEVRQAQRSLESKVAAQAELINRLVARIDEMSGTASEAPAAQSSRDALAAHAEQVADLAHRLDDLQDRQRVGKLADAELTQLVSAAEKNDAALQEQAGALGVDLTAPAGEAAAELLAQARTPPPPVGPAHQVQGQQPSTGDVIGGLQEGEWAPIPPFSPPADSPASRDPAAYNVAERFAPDLDDTYEDDGPTRPAHEIGQGYEIEGPAKSSPLATGTGRAVTSQELPELRRGGRRKWVVLAGALVVVGGGVGLALGGPWFSFWPANGTEEVVEREGTTMARTTAGREPTAAAPRPVPPPAPAQAPAAPRRDAAVADGASTAAAAETPDAGFDATEAEPDAAGGPDELEQEPEAHGSRLSPVARRRLRRRHLLRRGQRLLRLGRYKASRKYFTLALRMKDDHTVRWLLGRSHQRAGEAWAAIHHMKKAIARSPRARLAMRRYVLGHQYLKVGKKKHACEQFKKALAQDPKHVRARRSLKGNCQR